MPATPPTRLIWLYQAALIAQMFPAYRLSDVMRLPGTELRDLLAAMKLINTARAINQ